MHFNRATLSERSEGGRAQKRGEAMEIKNIRLNVPEESNIIVGQSHFIKTIEDLYEILVTSCPQSKFGAAFCEASGPCLIRVEGNDAELKKVAAENAMIVGAGHSFVLLLKDAFPINVLNAIKSCSEVCQIFCATANPLEVVIAETDQGRGIIGVIDGFSPKGVETDADVKARKEFLRKIGYKR
jgi:adenosine/AMP kinase